MASYLSGTADVLPCALESPSGVFLFLYLPVINALAFLAFGVDKCLAKAKLRHGALPRIPERRLLLLALLGGGGGAWLAMQSFRHKTRHRAFVVCVPLFALIWAVAWGIVFHTYRQG